MPGVAGEAVQFALAALNRRIAAGEPEGRYRALGRDGGAQREAKAARFRDSLEGGACGSKTQEECPLHRGQW